MTLTRFAQFVDDVARLRELQDLVPDRRHRKVHALKLRAAELLIDEQVRMFGHDADLIAAKEGMTPCGPVT